MSPQTIAVIGSGISGVSAAWLLSKRHQVTLFEANDYVGGHSNTIDLELGGRQVSVDTGFIVYNEHNYPNLTALLKHLNVPTVASEMSFALTLDEGAYEYSGSGANGFFGQRRNIVNSAHWQMLADVVRFFRTAQTRLVSYKDETTLGDFLRAEGYSRKFVDEHIIPMGAAIWSTDVDLMMNYPAKAFVDFYANHNLLKVLSRPNWRTLKDFSRSYVKALIADGAFSVLTNSGAASVNRTNGKVMVTDVHGTVRLFDQVVFASHADQTLKLLADPSADEQDLLSAFSYQRNVAVVHSDPCFMPKRKRLWSSWNYYRESQNGSQQVCVTYWMNALQQLDTKEDVFVTLNPPAHLQPKSVHRVIEYDHPVFDLRAISAQPELNRLQGVNNSWFCGAYFGHGFHEDGLQSGLDVAERLGGVMRPWSFDVRQSRIPANQQLLLDAAE